MMASAPPACVPPTLQVTATMQFHLKDEAFVYGKIKFCNMSPCNVILPAIQHYKCLNKAAELHRKAEKTCRLITL
jgi:hypothetical protein